MKRLRRRLFLLCTVSFGVSFIPLMSIFIRNYDRYVSSVSDAVKLSFGAVFVLIIFLLKAVGKLKIPGRLMTATVLVFFCWLFSTVLADLLLISAVWWISEAVDYFVLSPLIGRTKEAIRIKRTADATAEAIGGSR